MLELAKESWDAWSVAKADRVAVVERGWEQQEGMVDA